MKRRGGGQAAAFAILAGAWVVGCGDEWSPDEGGEIAVQTVSALNAEALPSSITVMPVILVPSGVAQPTSAEKTELMFQLNWARTRYSAMLSDVDTFTLAQTTVAVVNDTNSNHTPAFYTSSSNVYRGNDPEAVKVVMSAFGKDRFTNPYIYCIVIKGTPGGGGGGLTLNGGIGTGGGYVVFRGDVLLKDAQGNWKVPNFQSSLRHELGHSFGLLHSWDAYGSDLARYAASSGDSVMSYNTSHQTGPNHQEAPSPGILLPEEIRELSMNTRVFHNLTFDPTISIPANYTLRSPGVWFGEEDEMPGASRLSLVGAGIGCNEPEAFGSLMINMLSDPVQHPIVGGDAAYNGSKMFHTGVISDPDGWVSVEFFFGTPQAINAIGVHTAYGATGSDPDGTHPADAVEIYRFDVQGNRQHVIDAPVWIDDKVRFPQQTSDHWQVFLHSSAPVAPRYLVVRGFTFHTQGGSARASAYTDFPDFGAFTDVSNALQGTILPPGSPFDPARMWHSGPASAGWVNLTVQFPYAVPLNGLGVHTSYAGPTHPADRVELGTLNSSGSYTAVTAQDVGIDDTIAFTEQTSSRWQFWFHSSEADPYVVLRGLTFLTQQGEVFPPSYPRQKLNYPIVTSSGEDFFSRASHAVTGTILASSAAYDATKMWHSPSVGANGWIFADVTFPYAVELNGVAIHTQYGASVHRAQTVEVQYKNGPIFTSKGTKTNLVADDAIIFSAQKARTWRIRLQAKASGFVVVRGLEFFSPSGSNYPDRPARIIFHALDH